LPNKEEFLNQHIDDLQKQIWLLEISRDILAEPIRRTNDRKQQDEMIKLQNQFINQIKGNEQRIQFIRKVIHGPAQIPEEPPKENFIAK